jgi:hypothetical protein
MAETFLKIVVRTPREPSVRDRKDIAYAIGQALKGIEHTGEPRGNQITGAFVVEELG